MSVLYFVLAAAAPTTIGGVNGREVRAGGLRIEVEEPPADGALSEEPRGTARTGCRHAPPAAALAAVDPRRPGRIPHPCLHDHAECAVRHAAGLRGHRLVVLSEAFVPTALVFAVHLHSFAFVVLALAELAKFTDSVVIAVGAGALAMFSVLSYILVASRRVYGGGWPVVAAKTAGIGVLYPVASIPAFAIILAWASM